MAALSGLNSGSSGTSGQVRATINGTGSSTGIYLPPSFGVASGTVGAHRTFTGFSGGSITVGVSASTNSNTITGGVCNVNAIAVFTR